MERFLKERQTQRMAERRERMRLQSALSLTAAKRLALQRDPASLRGCLRENALGPSRKNALQLPLVQMAKDRMQRSDRGGLAVVEAQPLGQCAAIMTAPLDYRAVTWIAAEGGGAGQSQNGRERMATPLALAKVGNLAKKPYRKGHILVNRLSIRPVIAM